MFMPYQNKEYKTMQKYASTEQLLEAERLSPGLQSCLAQESLSYYRLFIDYFCNPAPDLSSKTALRTLRMKAV